MTSSSFTTTAHGKWILSGEHAVLRGTTALVFPIRQHTLSLSYQASDEPCRLELLGPETNELQLLFWGVLEQGLELSGTTLSAISGKFIIENAIPLGNGMGASAALCVVLARWFEHLNLLPNLSTFEFARRLENLFHSESSGVDIAGVGANHGLVYRRGEEPAPLVMNWQPIWTLTPSEQVGITTHCVRHVKELFQKQPTLANRTDAMMQSSSELAIKALAADADSGLPMLANAINQAKVCFSQWGLCGGKVEQRIEQLLQAGALAVKPTGSGDGGYLLALWQQEPPRRDDLAMLRV